MIIGILRELKEQESRVGLIPAFAENLVKSGHEVVVESGAGLSSGFTDEEYLTSGATIADSNRDIYSRANMLVKVQAPVKAEFGLLRENQIICSSLHLASSPETTEALVKAKVIGIAYETVTNYEGQLVLLAPMSAIAGRMSISVGANLLQKHLGGNGTLVSGVPGVQSAKIVIIGGGCVGTNASFVANGMGADVTVFDNKLASLKKIDDMFKGHVKTIFSTPKNISEAISNADIVIGAAHIAGCSAPKVITRDMLKKMKKGSVIIDISIDQGGCCETSRQTTHTNPCYEVDGVLHYCVPNMPGAYARTSTIALNNANYSLVEQIAALGCENALKANKHLLDGLNVYKGHITYERVADANSRPYKDPMELL